MDKIGTTSGQRAVQFYDRDDYSHSSSVGFLMRLALTSLRSHIDRRLAPHGLTHAQWVPLFKIANGDAINVMELARDMSLDPGALTRNLARLEAKGLLTRVRSDEDRRCVKLLPTDCGHEVARQVRSVVVDSLNQHLVGFSEQELASFTAMLQRFIANGGEANRGGSERDQDEDAKKDMHEPR